HHFPLQQGVADLGHGGVIEVGGQVDAVDLGADVARHRADVELELVDGAGHGTRLLGGENKGGGAPETGERRPRRTNEEGRTETRAALLESHPRLKTDLVNQEYREWACQASASSSYERTRSAWPWVMVVIT